MEIVVKDFIMPELYLSGVEAKPEDRDSGGFYRFWLLCDSVPHFGRQVAPLSSTAHSAPPDRDDRDSFALAKLGSVLDQCVTDFPDLGPQSVPI